MPIYEYQCQNCGKVMEVFQSSYSAKPPKQCEFCGISGQMTKIISQSSFILKGGGWYRDGYSGSGSGGGDSKSSDSSGDGDSDSGGSGGCCGGSCNCA